MFGFQRSEASEPVVVFRTRIPWNFRFASCIALPPGIRASGRVSRRDNARTNHAWRAARRGLPRTDALLRAYGLA